MAQATEVVRDHIDPRPPTGDAVGVAFFFKQWGAHDASGKRVGKKRAGRILDGATWNATPVKAA